VFFRHKETESRRLTNRFPPQPAEFTARADPLVNKTGLIAGKSHIFPVIWEYDIADPNDAPKIRQLPIPAGIFLCHDYCCERCRLWAMQALLT
jgi:hypothetical protein